MKIPRSSFVKPAAGHVSPLEGIGLNASNRLQEITGFGANPGALRAWGYVPPRLSAGAPLVVVLHGCTQDAANYDRGAGWSQLADELGFAVLLPEQQRANNPNLCFNWFSPIDSRRDSGEALSIRQMIAAMVEAYAIDVSRVFITGLSAGGAMTSIMLATYPEVFAAGAIIGGLPFGAAASVGDAFARMSGNGYPDVSELTAFVRRASPHTGPWPAISVWHANADTTVSASNADRIVSQWRSLHGIDAGSFEEQQVGRHTRRTWRDHASRAVVEQNIVIGMGHGTPLKTHGADSCGHPGPYMLEVGISSTRAIAQFWGLGDGQAVFAPTFEPVPALPAKPKVLAQARPSPLPKGVGAVIEDALRAAGLMK